MSNIDGLNTDQQIRSAGLDASWPVFVDELIMNMTKDGQQRRSLRYAGISSRHLKVIGVEEGSATIDKISNTSCGDGDVHEDAVCNSVDASYTLESQDEKAQELFTEYKDATNTAVNDGTYQNVLETVDPDTPLMIGVILPDGSKSGDSGGMPGWLLALIILLCILCCLCTIAALFFLMNKNNQDEDKQLEPYDEEGFAYDFLIPPNQKPQTEVDDEDATKDVEEDGEQFEDEDQDVGLAKNIGDDDEDNNLVVVMPEEVDEEEEEDDEEGDESEPEGDADDDEEAQEDEVLAIEAQEDEIRAIEDDPSDEEANLEDVDDEQEVPPDASGQLGVHEDPDGLRASSIEAESEEEAEAEDDWGSDGGDNNDDNKSDVEEAEGGDEEEWDDENKDEEGFEEGDDEGEDEWDDEDNTEGKK